MYDNVNNFQFTEEYLFEKTCTPAQNRKVTFLKLKT